MPDTATRSTHIISAYLAAPDQLEEAMHGLAESEMDVSLEPGKWTIRQLVHHIVDGDDMTKMIIKAALGNPGCLYDQSWYRSSGSWADALEYRRRLVGPGLELFRSNHLHVEQLLNRIPDALERHVLLKYEGINEPRPFTVGQLIETDSDHFQHHLRQIRETREKHGL